METTMVSAEQKSKSLVEWSAEVRKGTKLTFPDGSGRMIVQTARKGKDGLFLLEISPSTLPSNRGRKSTKNSGDLKESLTSYGFSGAEKKALFVSATETGVFFLADGTEIKRKEDYSWPLATKAEKKAVGAVKPTEYPFGKGIYAMYLSIERFIEDSGTVPEITEYLA